MNYYFLFALFISHSSFLYMGYKFGRKTQKWAMNQKKNNK